MENQRKDKPGSRLFAVGPADVPMAHIRLVRDSEPIPPRAIFLSTDTTIAAEDARARFRRIQSSANSMSAWLMARLRRLHERESWQ